MGNLGISNILLLIIPILVIQIGLIVLALVDLNKRDKVTGDSKILWVIIILLFQIFGPLAYFIIGRKE